jgi:hypothetical protein
MADVPPALTGVLPEAQERMASCEGAMTTSTCVNTESEAHDPANTTFEGAASQLAELGYSHEINKGHSCLDRSPPPPSAVQRISGGWRSHGGAEARREQREESTTRPGGQLACLVFLPVVLGHPWFPTGALHCPGHPSCAGA